MRDPCQKETKDPSHMPDHANGGVIGLFQHWQVHRSFDHYAKCHPQEGFVLLLRLRHHYEAMVQAKPRRHGDMGQLVQESRYEVKQEEPHGGFYL